MPVYKSTDFLVIDGANLDGPLSFAAELLLDDVYELGKSIEPLRQAFDAVSEIKFTVAEGTKIAAVGSALHLGIHGLYVTRRTNNRRLNLVEFDD